jgi:hypothetical protein
MSQKFVSKQQIQRERVYKFYNEHKDNRKLFTVNHFKAEHIPKRTIYRVIQRAENDSGYNRRLGSGRKPIKLPPPQTIANPYQSIRRER